MEFLIALVIVFIGIGAWINWHGDEVPSDEEYFDRINRHSYEDDDDDNDGDSDNDSDDGDSDSDGD